MAVTTYEGIVEKGKVRLKKGLRLPEKAKVYVIVPDVEVKQAVRILTPRLVHPEQAIDFKIETNL